MQRRGPTVVSWGPGCLDTNRFYAAFLYVRFNLSHCYKGPGFFSAAHQSVNTGDSWLFCLCVSDNQGWRHCIQGVHPSCSCDLSNNRSPNDNRAPDLRMNWQGCRDLFVIMNTCASYGNIIPPHLIFKMSKVNFTVSLYLGRACGVSVLEFGASLQQRPSLNQRSSGFWLLRHHVTKLFISHILNYVARTDTDVHCYIQPWEF